MYKCFSVGFTNGRGRFFTGKEPTSHAVYYLHWRVILKFMYMYIYFQELFDLPNKHRGEGVVGRNKIIWWRENYACVCLCVGGESVWALLYSIVHKQPWVWNPLLPQINITTQCELCKRQIIFEYPPEPTLGFDIATVWIQSFFGYMLINPSRDVVVSLFLNMCRWASLFPITPM